MLYRNDLTQPPVIPAPPSRISPSPAQTTRVHENTNLLTDADSDQAPHSKLSCIVETSETGNAKTVLVQLLQVLRIWWRCCIRLSDPLQSKPLLIMTLESID